MVSTAAIDQKSKNADVDTGATVASGVTSALSGSLSDATMGVAGVSGMDVARTAQGQEAVEEGTESAEAGADVFDGFHLCRSIRRVCGRSSCGFTGAGRTYRDREHRGADGEYRAGCCTAGGRALTDTRTSVWRMSRAISMSAQRQAPMRDVVGKMPNNAGCEILGVEGEWTQIKSGSVEAM